jgi:hypothetical protein
LARFDDEGTVVNDSYVEICVFGYNTNNNTSNMIVNGRDILTELSDKKNTLTTSSVLDVAELKNQKFRWKPDPNNLAYRLARFGDDGAVVTNSYVDVCVFGYNSDTNSGGIFSQN